MKIRKLFKRAAAFALAAVTALSAVPATTAYAAGDIGTISFTHTYDGAGNAMRYNSSANIGGHTAGGTGEYKYRMYVDGETAFCLQPGVPLKTGNTLAKASSNAWNALSAEQRKAVGLALLYGYQGNSGNLSGSDDEKWLATQTLVWEFVTGCRNSTSPYSQTSMTVYSLHFGSNYANSGARAAYDQIVSLMTRHSTIPSFMSAGKKDITKELAQLKDCTENSFLEELDGFNIEVIYKRLAANSVAYMLLSRCGLDADGYFEREDFLDITNFNTPATLNAIGIATSDISEMALREISAAIRNVQIEAKQQNRTFARDTISQYDKGRKQPERSEYNERNHLHETGGLSYSRPNITDRARASAWQIRFDPFRLSCKIWHSSRHCLRNSGKALSAMPMSSSLWAATSRVPISL